MMMNTDILRLTILINVQYESPFCDISLLSLVKVKSACLVFSCACPLFLRGDYGLNT